VTTYGTLHYHALRNERPIWSIDATPHVKITIKRVLPRVRATAQGKLRITDTLDVARDLAWVHSRYPLDMDDRTACALAERVDRYVERESFVNGILSGHPGTALAVTPARPPRDYQTKFVNLARQMKRLVLGDAWGLGKTCSGLLVLSEPDTLPALMVTLTHLPEQWIDELEMTWPGMLGHILTSTSPYDLRERCGGRIPDVIVTNYHKLAGWSHALAGQIRAVVFDEVQELRTGTGSAKGAAAANLAAEANYAIGLTPGMIYNYGDEAWNIYNILDPGFLGTREEFGREWCSTGNIITDPEAFGTYLRRSGRFLRRTRADVGREIPEPIQVRQEVDTDPQKLHELAGDTLQIAKLILSADSSSTQRWQARGDLDWRLRQATGIAKAPYVAAFVRMLLESEDRVLMFGWHRHCYDIWAELLADFNPVLYTGSESPKQKRASEKAFCGGPARVMMMSLRSGAGLDGLQRYCSVGVFGELDWSPEVHNNCIGRLARDGGKSDSAVVAYFMVSGEGADPVMEDVLGLKRAQSEPIRDPGAPRLKPAPQVGIDHLRLLAQSVVDRSAPAVRGA
jgi:hypothetical protein